MSFDYPNRIGPFVHKDVRDATLMYVEGCMPWVEHNFIRAGDARQYAVRLANRELLVHEWNRHEGHDKFMKDLMHAKNNNAFRKMELYHYTRMLCISLKTPRTLGDQTDVQTIWFWY